MYHRELACLSQMCFSQFNFLMASEWLHIRPWRIFSVGNLIREFSKSFVGLYFNLRNIRKSILSHTRDIRKADFLIRICSRMDAMSRI